MISRAVLPLVILGAFCAGVGHGFTSAFSCPVEVFNCLASEQCDSCLDALGDTGLTVGGFDFELCSELYEDVCVVATAQECDVDNVELVDLLSCVAEDLYGCNDFTTCEEALAASGSDGLFETTEAPPPAPSAAGGTPAPATADAPPTFTVPTVPLPSAAPSSGSRGGIFAPTTAPTGSGTGMLGTAHPSSSMFEFTTDSMTGSSSSAISAAPTAASADGSRGGIGSTFSVSPTAAPSGLEGADGLEDGANGGVVTRPTGSSSGAWCFSLLSAVVGLVSALAARAA